MLTLFKHNRVLWLHNVYSILYKMLYYITYACKLRSYISKNYINYIYII